ncbi:MAG: Na+/H+ antiporter subunit E [Myxococcota bacterium]
MMKIHAAVVLIYRFVFALVTSGLTTAWVILRPASELQPGFIRMSFGAIDRRGAVLLSGLTSLTPGTTVVDIDFERHELLVHLLDVREAEATVRHILEHFEAPLTLLCPLRGRP